MGLKPELALSSIPTSDGTMGRLLTASLGLSFPIDERTLIDSPVTLESNLDSHSSGPSQLFRVLRRCSAARADGTAEGSPSAPSTCQSQ